MGRTGHPPASTTAWDGNGLVITTLYPYQDPGTGELRRQKVVQTLWLASPAGTPWEPTLVVETSRADVTGGADMVNRTVYTRGYR